MCQDEISPNRRQSEAFLTFFEKPCRRLTAEHVFGLNSSQIKVVFLSKKLKLIIGTTDHEPNPCP